MTAKTLMVVQMVTIHMNKTMKISTRMSKKMSMNQLMKFHWIAL